MFVSVVPTSSRPVMVVDGDGRVFALTTSSTDDRFCVSISGVLDAGASEHVRDACLGGGDLDVIVDPRQVADAASSNWTARPPLHRAVEVRPTIERAVRAIAVSDTMSTDHAVMLVQRHAPTEPVSSRIGADPNVPGLLPDIVTDCSGPDRAVLARPSIVSQTGDEARALTAMCDLFRISCVLAPLADEPDEVGRCARAVIVELDHLTVDMRASVTGTTVPLHQVFQRTQRLVNEISDRLIHPDATLNGRPVPAGTAPVRATLITRAVELARDAIVGLSPDANGSDRGPTRAAGD